MSMAELLQCLPVFLRPNPAFGADCSMNRTGGAREHDMPSRANSKGEHMCSGLASDRLTDVHTDDGHGLTDEERQFFFEYLLHGKAMGLPLPTVERSPIV